MTKRLKILVFVDNEFIIRNFILNNSFGELSRQHEVAFVYPPAGWKRLSIDPLALPHPEGSRVLWVRMPSERIYIWRLLALSEQLRLRFGKGYRERRRLVRKHSGWKAALQFTVYGLPGIRQIYRAWQKARLDKLYDCVEFREFLRDENPDLLIHPSTFDGYFINDFVAEGKRLGIPTMLVMNSWDNPSLKNAMSGAPDQTLVWGQQTVNHAVRYMHLRRETVRVLGAAQFELFRHPPQLDRAAFCAEHGMDPAQKIILYAGSSRHAREYEHLQDLSAAIGRGEFGDAVVLYRPHPWGGGGADGSRIVCDPLPHVVLENSMRRYMEEVQAGHSKYSVLEADYARTHTVLSAADVVISPLSTIILEGVLHHKPVMCFIPADEAAASRSLGLRIGLDHFSELFHSPAMLVGWERSALVQSTKELLSRADDPNFHRVLDHEVNFFVEFPQKPWPEALVDTVDQMLESKADIHAES